MSYPVYYTNTDRNRLSVASIFYVKNKAAYLKERHVSNATRKFYISIFFIFTFSLKIHVYLTDSIYFK